MGERTAISWTNATWNPLRGTGGAAAGSLVLPLPGAPENPVPGRWVCKKISPGCDFCYASTLNKRFGGAEYGREGAPLVDALRLDRRQLLQPLTKWAKKPKVIFFSSMTDVFGGWVPHDWLDQCFAVMALTPQHVYQVLTKRPTEMRDYLLSPTTPARIVEAARDLLQEIGRPPVITSWPGWPLPNVWLGTSVETDAYVWRANRLAECPAVVRFISAEPLLGPLPSLYGAVEALPCPTCRTLGRLSRGDPWGTCPDCANSPAGYGFHPGPIHWVIIGGESAGPPERALVEPCTYTHRPEWETCKACDGTGWRPKPAMLGAVRSIVETCRSQGVPVWMKQWGGKRPDTAGHLLDGVVAQAWPFGWEERLQGAGTDEPTPAPAEAGARP